MPRGNKKKEEVETIPATHQFYNIADANRLRLRLLEHSTLAGAGFNNVTIDTFDMRTQSFKDCVVKGTTFKNINMQGCDFSGALECTGNTFIDCDLRWGKKPEGFEANNTFENTRL